MDAPEQPGTPVRGTERPADASAAEEQKQRMAAALQRERARLGLSLSEAAKRAGVSKSTLSQLESGTGNPSVETMWALAAAYDVQLSQLLDPPRTRMSVVRFADLPQLPSSTSHYAAALLSASPPGARRDVYLITAEPGPPRASAPHPAGTVEHVILAAGRARLVCDGDAETTDAGDYLSYPGDTPHSFEALTAGTMAVYVIDS